MTSEFTHTVRAVELALAATLIPTGARVLELGAGDGWQAAELCRQGFEVEAVDVSPPRKGTPLHFPVKRYDGRILPFSDNCFDAVFSSNVLEHVADLESIQRELLRVLRPGGIAVHCVPSSTWRALTTIGHPFYVVKLALRLATRRAAQKPILCEHQTSRLRSSPLDLIRLALVSARHGEEGTVVSEHWLFSKRNWFNRLNAAGWHVQLCLPTGICYTGNELLGTGLAMSTRHRLATVFGSSTLLFTLRPVTADAR